MTERSQGQVRHIRDLRDFKPRELAKLCYLGACTNLVFQLPSPGDYHVGWIMITAAPVAQRMLLFAVPSQDIDRPVPPRAIQEILQPVQLLDLFPSVEDYEERVLGNALGPRAVLAHFREMNATRSEAMELL